MTKYRPIDSALIDAEEVAGGNRYANRQIAIWMHELGYRDPDAPDPVDTSLYLEGETHDGYLLVDFGQSYVAFYNSDDQCVTASAGSFIINRGGGRFQLMSADDFEQTYIEVRDA